MPPVNPRNNVPAFRRKHKETPAVLHSLPDMQIGGLHCKLRVIQYSHTKPLLDIRQWLVIPPGTMDFKTGEVNERGYSGFGQRGLSMDLDTLIQLRDKIIPQAIELLSMETPVNESTTGDQGN